MYEKISSNKRLAKNTLVMYIRMLVMMAVSLYTSRVILSSLGVEDYGIYSVVGGVIAMFGFISNSMSTCTQRYLTFEIGRNDIDGVRQTFNTSILIHILIAGIILILAETIGLWFLYNKLVIPADRFSAALWAYQLSMFSAIVLILSVPYNALIIANEKMSMFAYISVIESILKLGVAFLIFTSDVDKLILYAFLMFVVQCLSLFFYIFYDHREFKDQCALSYGYERSRFSDMISFAGWDLYGNMSVVARTQGINVLLNMFFGAIANAASGIATQVQGAVMSFANNVIIAVRPQIVIAYTNKDYDRMNYLLNRTSIFTFVLISMLSIPIIIETPYILQLWLKEVPEFTVVFCRLTILFNLFALLSTIIMIGIHATGRIKRPSIINGTIYIFVVPISYFWYKNGGSPYFAYLFNVVAVFMGMVLNALTLHHNLPEFSFRDYLKKVILRAIIYLGSSATIIYIISNLIEHSFLKLLLSCVLSMIISLLICRVELSEVEYKQILNQIKKWINR